jgi:hypothetical protein
MRLRQGTAAVAITPSLDPSWVGPLASLRQAGVAPIAIVVDPLLHLQAAIEAEGQAPLSPSEREPREQELRALLHVLAEHDVRAFVLGPGRPLGEQLVTTRDGAAAVTT